MAKRNAVEALVQQKQMINIFVAGRNEYNKNLHKFFAVVSINPENNNIGVTFIPPSLGLDIDQDGDIVPLDKIEMNNFKKVSNAFEKATKIKTQFYMTIYAPDVARVIDIIEGINLYLISSLNPFEKMKDGINYFDGYKAMHYINKVEKNSIFRKFDKIQDVVSSIYLNKEKYLKFVNRELVTIVLNNVKTNMLPQEVISALNIAGKEGKLNFTVLPGKYSKNGVYYMDEVSSVEYRRFLKDIVIEEKGETNIKVKLLNATDLPGLAFKTRTLLMREGVIVVEFGNYLDAVYSDTIVINQKGYLSESYYIASLIGVNKIYTITDNSQLHSVMILIGKDFIK